MEEAKTEMEYRYLGKSGLRVSLIGYGPPMLLPTPPEDLTPVIESSYECLKLAIEHGVNFIDTAELYGHGATETVMGHVFKRVMTDLNIKRKDLVITCKIYYGGSGQNDCGLNRKHIIEGVHASLERIQLDYVDMIMAHRADRNTPIEETARAFNYVIEQGLAFYWGNLVYSELVIFN